MTRLTGWFPADVKPVREGVYEVDARRRGRRSFAHWSGAYWGLVSWTDTPGNPIERSASKQYADIKNLWMGNVSWRGLAKESK